jgi:hypothetical protein
MITLAYFTVLLRRYINASCIVRTNMHHADILTYVSWITNLPVKYKLWSSGDPDSNGCVQWCKDWKKKTPSGAREVLVKVELPFTVVNELATWMRVAWRFEPNRQLPTHCENYHCEYDSALREDKLWIISISATTCLTLLLIHTPFVFRAIVLLIWGRAPAADPEMKDSKKNIDPQVISVVAVKIAWGSMFFLESFVPGSAAVGWVRDRRTAALSALARGACNKFLCRRVAWPTASLGVHQISRKQRTKTSWKRFPYCHYFRKLL